MGHQCNHPSVCSPLPSSCCGVVGLAAPGQQLALRDGPMFGRKEQLRLQHSLLPPRVPTTLLCVFLQIGTPVMRGVVFGDIGVNPDVASPDPCGGSVPKAGALVLTFLLNNFRDPEYQKMAERWEKEVSLGALCAVCCLALPHSRTPALSGMVGDGGTVHVHNGCRCCLGGGRKSCCARGLPAGRWPIHGSMLLWPKTGNVNVVVAGVESFRSIVPSKP